ncbi:fam-a protein, fragment [Plasmodium vinckei]|uniref:Fam-a protein n=1 Tax=Plasmodium vinckei TaxID=5860 RepID=A0A6V7SD44_PLAVN|nr:fam-a protein, fragment [Plasmodium vinckei]
MNKFYIQFVFFLLSIFICVNNKTLATVPTPKKQNNKTLPTVVTPKKQNNKTLATVLTPKEQNNKTLPTVLTPKEQNNKTLPTGVTPKEQNNKTLPTVVTPKEQNNKTLPTGVSQREQIDKLFDIGLTPGEQSIKLFNAVLPPEELNKRNREYALSLEDHIRIDAEIRRSIAFCPEEIYKQNKDLLCTNPNEIKNAENFMNETVTQLEHHATNNDSYDVYDIRNGQLEKMILNIGGYLIENRDWYTEFNYLEAIDGHISNNRKLSIRKALKKNFHPDE